MKRDLNMIAIITFLSAMARAEAALEMVLADKAGSVTTAVSRP